MFLPYSGYVNVRAQLANTLISLLWTVVFVGPLYVFRAHHISHTSLYVFFAIAAVSMALPKALLQRLALSTHTARYRRLYVPMVITFTQDAAWLRRISGSQKPRVRRDATTMAKLVRDTWARERFHLSLLVFYSLCIVVAILHMQFVWAGALIVCNVIYNLYPIWLQQYLRLRVSRCRKILIDAHLS